MSANRVKETTTSTSTATVALGGRAANHRAFSSGFAAGATNIRAMIGPDANGAWLLGLYTLTNAGTLTRTAIIDSSADGADVTLAAGTKEVFHTLDADYLAGTTIDQLPTASSIADAYVLELVDPATGASYKATVSALKSIFGTGTGTGSGTTDTTAPTATSAAVANATPTVVAITMSEALDAAYVPAASAFTVGGHTVSSVAISGSTINLTVSAAFVNGEAASAVGYTKPATNYARDTAGNALATFSGLSITNNVAAAGGGGTAPGAPTVDANKSYTTSSALNVYVNTPASGGAPTGYTVEVYKSSDNSLVTSGTATSAGLVNISGASLVANTSYYVKAKASNGSGTSGYSAQTAFKWYGSTIGGYNGNTLKSPIDASTATTYSPLKQIPSYKQGTLASYEQYWTVGDMSVSGASAGWGNSATVPPNTVTYAENVNGGSSLNGLYGMDKAAAFANNTNLWVTAGSGSTTWHFWIKPADSFAFYVGASNVTGA